MACLLLSTLLVSTHVRVSGRGRVCSPICPDDEVGVHAATCPPQLCAEDLPAVMQEVVLPLAYIGAIRCMHAAEACSCHFPGMREPPPLPIHTFGDSTIRQLSYAIRHGQHSSALINSVNVEQQAAWCTRHTKNTSTLCTEATMRVMDDQNVNKKLLNKQKNIRKNETGYSSGDCQGSDRCDRQWPVTTPPPTHFVVRYLGD